MAPFALFALLHTASAGSIVDSQEQTIEVDSPQRIVTVAGNVTETVFALGLGDQVVGVDASSLYPAAVHQLPKIGYYRDINAEGVLSMSPDLIIATDAAGPPGVLEQLRGSGVPLAVLDSAQSIEGAQDRIMQIATLLDRSDEGERLKAQMQTELESVTRPESAPKVLFVYARGGGTQMVAGRDTAAAAMIELAGGVNAVSGYEGYKPMNAEAIIEANPDCILFSKRGLESVGGVEAAAQLSGVSLTTAGQNKKIIAIDDLVLLGFGPRTAQGVVELSRAIQE